MHRTPVGVFGASGYSGIEATRLILGHERLELRFVTSDRWVDTTLAAKLSEAGRAGDLRYVTVERGLELARECGAVFLATPAEASLSLAPKLLATGVLVIDLSGAFRLGDESQYPRFYSFEHPHPALLEQAVYGLPELFRADIPAARLLANPGCYATAAALQLAPLLKAGLLEDESVVISAASGVTGAGRKASEDFSFNEVDEDFRAYRVLRHQHTPEISQTLARAGGREVPLTFTPHLLPLRRGIVSTAHARAREGVDAGALRAALVEAYRREPFLRVLQSADEVNLKHVVGTNRCHVGVSLEASGCDPRRVVVTASIDNLVKGAAGQAMQNLNLMLGLDEGLALSGLRAFYP